MATPRNDDEEPLSCPRSPCDPNCLLLQLIQAKLEGLLHGEIIVRFRDGKPVQVVRTESELIR